MNNNREKAALNAMSYAASVGDSREYYKQLQLWREARFITKYIKLAEKFALSIACPASPFRNI